MFLSGLGPAVRGITFLAIDTTGIEGSNEEDMTVLVSQLATACPALQTLQFAGNVSRSLLAAFGTACPAICSVNLISSLPHSTLQQLHLILPNLTNICIRGALSQGILPTLPAPCCLSLFTCTTLALFNIGSCFLAPETWYVLPCQLKQLGCALETEPLVGLQVLSNLKRFDCFCQPFQNRVEGLSLLAVLRAAPLLEFLHLQGEGRENFHAIMSSVVLQCSPSMIPDLMYLHQRVSNGLRIGSVLTSEEYLSGLNLNLCDPSPRMSGRKVLKFMASMQPLPKFTGLTLDVVECISIAGDDHTQTITSMIPEKFPNLICLSICLCDDASLDSLVHLAACKCLEFLCIENGRVTLAQLARLCAHLPSLKIIQLHTTQCSVNDGIELETLQVAWGVNTKVRVNLPLYLAHQM